MSFYAGSSSRTTNDFGKSGDERAQVVNDILDVEPLLRATCTHEIDATQSVAAVLAELLAIGDDVSCRTTRGAAVVACASARECHPTVSRPIGHPTRGVTVYAVTLRQCLRECCFDTTAVRWL